jgi:hypothetical protein
MSFTDSQKAAWERIAEVCKKEEDKRIGWHFDEVKTLRMRYGDYTSPEIYAEVQYLPPSFGFAPHRMRAKVRIYIDLCMGQVLPPERGITLCDNDHPFGEENGWHIAWGFVRENEGRIDLFLEN